MYSFYYHFFFYIRWRSNYQEGVGIPLTG